MKGQRTKRGFRVAECCEDCTNGEVVYKGDFGDQEGFALVCKLDREITQEFYVCDKFAKFPYPKTGGLRNGNLKVQ